MLFSEIIYGPIHSRRLGVSLGVNLLPIDHKLCTFDCVYCECGWNQLVQQGQHPQLPSPDKVKNALHTKLEQLKNEQTPLDVITFSGNGEPTLHPDFLQIIIDTIDLRNIFYPNAKVSVLSNSTQLGRPDVVKALQLCDNRILKLDSAINSTMQLIDQPNNDNLTVTQIEQWLQAFNGNFTLQTCFLQGEMDGRIIDNTTPQELNAYYQMVDRLHPQQIMIYVIDRATPLQTLTRISKEQMLSIAEPLRQKNYDVIVSA